MNGPVVQTAVDLILGFTLLFVIALLILGICVAVSTIGKLLHEKPPKSAAVDEGLAGKPELSLREYQHGCLRTAKRRALALNEDQAQLVECGLGFGAEAGEFSDIIKKHFFHGHPLDKEKLMEEMGDAFWYAAVSAHVLGFDLAKMLEGNLAKLRQRYPNGFDSARSLNRSC